MESEVKVINFVLFFVIVNKWVSLLMVLYGLSVISDFLSV